MQLAASGPDKVGENRKLCFPQDCCGRDIMIEVWDGSCGGEIDNHHEIDPSIK